MAPQYWQAETHSYIYIFHIRGNDKAGSSEGNFTIEKPLNCFSCFAWDLVCGLTVSKPYVQMNTIKNHVKPKTCLLFCLINDNHLAILFT